MRRIVFIIAFCLLFGCAAQRPLTERELDFAKQSANFPTSFTLPNDQAEAAWGRAQTFIAQFSNMKLQIATQYVLQTYNPTGAWPIYGYNVTRTPLGDKTQFTVQCMSSNMFAKKEVQQNASTMAYYMATGELEPAFIFR